MSIADKLNYLNDTKEGLRIAINQLGGRLTKTTPFRNYGDGLNYLYSKIPKVEEEGENITFNDVASALMKLDLKGNTSQTGTPTPTSPIPVSVVSGDNDVVVCGKNLTNVNRLTTRTTNGITITNNGDGSITLSGTSTGEIALDFQIPITTLINGNTYTFSKRTTIGSGLYALLFRTPSNQGIPNSVLNTNLDSGDGYKILTCNSNVEIGYMRLYIPNNKVITNHTIYPMLEKGSSMTTFKPYQSQTYEVDLPVENLFNINATPYQVGGNTTYSVSGNTLNVKGEWFIAYKINVSKNTDYYISANRERISGTAGEISIYDGSVQTQIANASLQNYTFNSGNNSTINIVLYAGGGTSGEANFTNIQLEKGSKQNSFTPYGTTPIEYNAIGDYKDEFVKSSGKNLWDEEMEAGGYDLTTGEKNNTANYRCVNYIPIIPNSSMKILKPIGVYTRIIFYDENKTFISAPDVVYTNQFYSSFTSPSNAYYMTFYVTNAYVTPYKNDIMIYYGTTNIPYEPYGTGQYFLRKNIIKYTFTGNEQPNSITGGFYYYINATGNIAYIIGGFNTKFQFVNDDRITDNGTANTYLSDNQMAFRLGTTKDRLYIKTQLSESDLKSALANTPLYYVTQTPQGILLNDTLQNQIEDIYNETMSYEGQTNISQVNNDLAFKITAKALTKIVFEDGE